MATQDALDLLRLNLADPSEEGDGTDSFFSDAELTAYLDAVDGSEPRARVSALRPMVADAAKAAAKFTEGDYSEEVKLYDRLVAMLAAAEAEVAILDEQDAALVRGKARLPTTVAVRWYF
jgi:hypothetical protein